MSSTEPASEPSAAAVVEPGVGHDGGLDAGDAGAGLSAALGTPDVPGPAGAVGLRPTKAVPRGRARKRPPHWIALEWFLIIVAAISVALLVRATVVQAFYIPSESMVPTLKVHDRLLVDKITFHVRDVRRGDIVVFKKPKALKETDIKDLIKRVVGLPGETVEGRNGHVFINGKQLPEPYLHKGVDTAPFAPVIVPVDAYFVMGDNRPFSNDSRYWGTVDRSLIVGRAMFRIWPPTRIGRF